MRISTADKDDSSKLKCCKTRHLSYACRLGMANRDGSTTLERQEQACPAFADSADSNRVQMQETIPRTSKVSLLVWTTTVLSNLHRENSRMSVGPDMQCISYYCDVARYGWDAIH